MVIIKSSQLEAHLHPKGAEIHKIIGLSDGMNYMWRRDPVLWANSAPILFPIVGKVVNDTYRVDGKEYHLTQHGFARHNEFEIAEQGDDFVVFTLDYTNFLDVYPYKFRLTVTYKVEGLVLTCHCKVENLDTKEIYFGIGGHPAFACPMYENESANDYYIEFEKEETLDRHMINTAVSLFNGQTQPLFDHEKKFMVRQATFKDDAVIVHDFKSSWVALRSLNHNRAIKFHMNNWKWLGIWASKHVGGLIAIEPWNGHTDVEGFTGEYKEKEGLINLPVDSTFECEFNVEVIEGM